MYLYLLSIVFYPSSILLSSYATDGETAALVVGVLREQVRRGEVQALSVRCIAELWLPVVAVAASVAQTTIVVVVVASAEEGTFYPSSILLSSYATDGETVAFAEAAVLRVQTRRVEIQVPSGRRSVGLRLPVAAVAASVVQTTIAVAVAASAEEGKPQKQHRMAPDCVHFITLFRKCQ